MTAEIDALPDVIRSRSAGSIEQWAYPIVGIAGKLRNVIVDRKSYNAMHSSIPLSKILPAFEERFTAGSQPIQNGTAHRHPIGDRR